jgi:hypothetical protein
VANCVAIPAVEAKLLCSSAPSITHSTEMRVINGGLSEVGFVDPHDPTGSLPAMPHLNHFIRCHPL